MRFKCALSPERFAPVLAERLLEYNASRTREKLFLETVSCTDTHLKMKVGADSAAGSLYFDGTLQSEQGTLVIEGQMVREPPLTVVTLAYTLLLRIVALLSVLVVSAAAVWLFRRAVGGLDLWPPYVVPALLFLLVAVNLVRDALFAKRRFCRFMVAYMSCTETEDVPRVRRKKRTHGRYRHLRHLFLYHLLRFPVRLYLRAVLNYHGPRPLKLKENFIIVSNHVTDYDMLFLALAMKRHLYFVAGGHALRWGLPSRLLRWAFDPISRSKGASATSTVMEILRRSKKGHNIGLFPEGFRTLSGVNNTFSASTGGMIKKMNCSLVTFRIKGGYFTTPDWSREIRRGKMWGEFAGVYSSAQLAEMTPEAIDGLIARDIHEDAYETQEIHRIPYLAKGPAGAPAERIEFALVACPQCHGLGTLTSAGDRFFCPCGLEGVYDVYGSLVGDKLPFHRITHWDAWQQAHIEALPDYPDEQVLYECEGPQLLEVDELAHTTLLVAEGRLVQTNLALQVGDKRIPYTEIVYLDVFRHGYLLFTTRDKKYYEVSGEAKFPGMLCKQLFLRYTRHK
ncbi:MAG: lysophospholipid acyltransferase family protein [Eubacteriales bacterium]